MSRATTRLALLVFLLAGAAAAALLVVLKTATPSRPAEAVLATALPPVELAEHVARRYRVGQAAAKRTIDAAYRSAKEAGIDPLLVLAVIGVESSFNPAAESGAGAKGLMQIVPAWHRKRLDGFGGEDAVLDPLINIAVGTRILDEYIERAGSLEAGLQRYNGSASDPSLRYARKVFAERERLRRMHEEGALFPGRL